MTVSIRFDCRKWRRSKVGKIVSNSSEFLQHWPAVGNMQLYINANVSTSIIAADTSLIHEIVLQQCYECYIISLTIRGSISHPLTAAESAQHEKDVGRK
jgi:hypothetical protein